MINEQKPVEQKDPLSTDDCPMCQDMGKEDHKSDDCEMCQAYDAQQNASGAIDDCPACKDYDNKELSHNDGCPMCAEVDGKQIGEDESSEFDDCPECQKLYSEASENSPAENAQELPPEQGMETKEQLLQAIDQTPSLNAPTPHEAAKQIDNTELPQGLASDGNKSVPENFGDAQESADASQPGQEGQQSQGGPEMGDVLKDGLQDQEDDIRRQKVIDLVGNALQGFKSNKQILENLKLQEPQFYTSNIMMLRAMIELCGMLGLEPKRDQTSLESPAPVPKAPAQPAPIPAAPQEGAAKPPQR